MVKYRILNPIFFALILMALALSSCKDWLSVAPENDLIKEKFWTKKQDVDGALAATYAAFRGGAVKSFVWGELRADIVKFGDTKGDYNRIAASDISASNNEIKWEDYYKTINLANTLMYYDKQVFAKDKIFTQKIKNGVEAEALFLRSLSYFYVARVWKEAPLVLKPSISDTSKLFLPKVSEKVIIQQIIKDLLIAKDLAYTTEFKDDVLHPGYFNGRANKFSIMALLADVYLWDEQYQNCIDYCDSVTNSNLYSLEPSITWFNNYFPGNSPKESIFEIQYNTNLKQENPFYNDFLYNNQIDFKIIVASLFGKEDLRAVSFGVTNPDFALKYKASNVSSGNIVTRSPSQKDGHFIYYRYADILLMKAEAATELNNLPLANEMVKQTMDRAYMSFTDLTDKDELRKTILDERGREFIMEGKRWFDLLRAAKRNHFAKKQIIIDMILSGADIQLQAILRTKVYDTMSYYLPIPERDLLYDPFLLQNTFYNR